jgi:hypothetical protein
MNLIAIVARLYGRYGHPAVVVGGLGRTGVNRQTEIGREEALLGSKSSAEGIDDHVRLLDKSEGAISRISDHLEVFAIVI